MRAAKRIGSVRPSGSLGSTGNQGLPPAKGSQPEGIWSRRSSAQARSSADSLAIRSSSSLIAHHVRENLSGAISERLAVLASQPSPCPIVALVRLVFGWRHLASLSGQPLVLGQLGLLFFAISNLLSVRSRGTTPRPRWLSPSPLPASPRPPQRRPWPSGASTRNPRRRSPRRWSGWNREAGRPPRAAGRGRRQAGRRRRQGATADSRCPAAAAARERSAQSRCLASHSARASSSFR